MLFLCANAPLHTQNRRYYDNIRNVVQKMSSGFEKFKQEMNVNSGFDRRVKKFQETSQTTRKTSGCTAARADATQSRLAKEPGAAVNGGCGITPFTEDDRRMSKRCLRIARNRSVIPFCQMPIAKRSANHGCEREGCALHW